MNGTPMEAVQTGTDTIVGITTNEHSICLGLPQQSNAPYGADSTKGTSIMTDYTPPTDDDGTITRYAWPGAYFLWYVTHDGATLCGKCVEDNRDQTLDPTDNSGWRIVGHFHSGESDDPEQEVCDHCNYTEQGVTQ